MSGMKDFMWVERYRPEKFEDFVLAPDLKQHVETWIKENNIPHLIFHSPVPGTGKTSLSRFLVETLDCEYKEIKASDENDIETIRTKVKSFCEKKSMYPLKVVLMSEAGGLSRDAQAALQDIIEEYSENTRFIFTLNSINKLIDTVVSRCQVFELTALPREIVVDKMISILKSEQIEYSKEDLEFIIELYYPDCRKIINSLHQGSTSGNRLIVEREQFLDYSAVIVFKLMEHHSYEDILEYVKTEKIFNYIKIYNMLLEHVDDFTATFEDKRKSMEAIFEHNYRDSVAVDKQTNFMYLIFKLTTINKKK